MHVKNLALLSWRVLLGLKSLNNEERFRKSWLSYSLVNQEGEGFGKRQWWCSVVCWWYIFPKKLILNSSLSSTRIYPNLLTSIITWVDSKISSWWSYFPLHPMSSHMHVRTIPRCFWILSRYVNVIYTTTLVLSEIWDL